MSAATIDGADLFGRIRRHGFSFFAGVPCSSFGSLYRAIEGASDVPVLASVREDEAVAAAAGAALAGARPVVLMQNSGLGNALNALSSLTLLYRLPCLLLVGWRGFEGRDAPEHRIMGQAMPDVLRAVGLDPEMLAPARVDEQLAAARCGMDAGECRVLAVREGMIR